MLKQKRIKRQDFRKRCRSPASLPASAFIAISLFFLSIGSTAVLSSQTAYQSHDSILGTVKEFILEKTAATLGSEGEITVSRLDSRLLLHKCSSQLTAFSSATEQFIGRTTVGVQCDTPKPWTIYVQAHIKAYSEVLVSTRAMKRNEQLDASDISLEKRELSSLPNLYLYQSDQATGLVLSRPIQRGTVLTSNILKAPKLVHRGQKISLLAERNGIKVYIKGKSLSDGISGQRVKVKNLGSNRIIEGIVIDEGTVKVIL